MTRRRRVLSPPFGRKGSKLRQGPWIVSELDRIPHDKFGELFAGTCAVTLFKKPTTWEFLNDADRWIAGFLAVCRNRKQLAELLRRLRYTAWDVTDFEHCVVVLRGSLPAPDDPVERARVFLVGNQQSFDKSQRTHSISDTSSGITKWKRIHEHINAMARRIQAVQVFCRDYADVLRMNIVNDHRLVTSVAKYRHKLRHLPRYMDLCLHAINDELRVVCGDGHRFAITTVQDDHWNHQDRMFVIPAEQACVIAEVFRHDASYVGLTFAMNDEGTRTKGCTISSDADIDMGLTFHAEEYVNYVKHAYRDDPPEIIVDVRKPALARALPLLNASWLWDAGANTYRWLRFTASEQAQTLTLADMSFLDDNDKPHAIQEVPCRVNACKATSYDECYATRCLLDILIRP